MGLRVLCICPYHIPHYVDRARQCFARQTYTQIAFSEWDTSKEKQSVGALRNAMIRERFDCDVIAHADHDDWSSPERLAQQVALMEITGKSVVGYYDMPFYDERSDRVTWYDSRMRNYCLGTSLMYRRELWERIPFPDCTPEDTTWQRNVGFDNMASISSLRNGKPMMIQTLHSANGAATSGGARFDPASPELEREVRNILATQAAFVAQSQA